MDRVDLGKVDNGWGNQNQRSGNESSVEFNNIYSNTNNSNQTQYNNQQFSNQYIDNSFESEMANKWNWGAAFLPLYFGIFNKAWLTLLGLVPVLGIFWWIICGIKGSKWALESGVYNTLDAYETSMKNWNRLGIAVLIIAIVFAILWVVIMVSMTYFLMNSTPENIIRY